MTILKFTLTMPRRPIARWSGEECEYNHVKNMGRSKKTTEEAAKLDGKTFRYDFGDGWVAQIDVRVIDCNEAVKARNASHGFMGYGWMWASILKHGDIRYEDKQ